MIVVVTYECGDKVMEYVFVHEDKKRVVLS